MWSFVDAKESERWLWHAIDHHTGKVLAYVVGTRKDAMFLARIIHEQKEDERKLYSTGRHRVMNMTNSEEERKKGENYKRRQTHRGV